VGWCGRRPHSNILTIHDVGRHGDIACFAKDWLLAQQIADGLAAAQAARDSGWRPVRGARADRAGSLLVQLLPLGLRHADEPHVAEVRRERRPSRESATLHAQFLLDIARIDDTLRAFIAPGGRRPTRQSSSSSDTVTPRSRCKSPHLSQVS
jgi:hypothetical protein